MNDPARPPVRPRAVFVDRVTVLIVSLRAPRRERDELNSADDPAELLREVIRLGRCVGDVNRDGNLDIIYTYSDSVAILLGNGDGTFRDGPRYQLVGGSGTQAVADGDGWVINGQKVWTSYALMAQWCILAACTDPTASASRRITLFLLPMDRDGVTARPIPSMLGPHHLNEVFLDNVRVGQEDVLGEVGGGWRVIKDALAYERVGIARYARCDSLLARLRDALGEQWDALPGALRTRWVRAMIDVRVARLLAYTAVAQQESGQPDDATASIARSSIASGSTTTAPTPWPSGSAG